VRDVIAARYHPQLTARQLWRARRGPDAAAPEPRAWGLPERRDVLLTASGGDALMLALGAVAARGCVVTPAYTCGRVIGAIRAANWTPRYVDVDPRTLELDPMQLERALAGGGVGAVLVTHYFGFAADVAATAALLKGRGVALIEDCALAQGALRGGQPAGSHGDFAVYSFGRGKGVDLGLGGALVGRALPEAVAPARTRANLARRAWLASRGPWMAKYRLVDLVKRMPGVRPASAGPAALAFDAATLDGEGTRLLRRLLAAVDAPAILEHRRRRARQIADALRGVRATWWRTIAAGADASPCPPAFPLLCTDRPVALRRLRRAGVDCPSFFDYSAAALDGAGPFPGSDEIARSIVQVPLHEGIDDARLERVLHELLA
jgi:dTDP-4-amino-4,6-dideoxygalactose transaminase